MPKNKAYAIILGILLLMYSITFNQESPKLNFKGIVASEHGQIVDGHHRGIPFAYPIWLHRNYFRLQVNSKLSNYLEVIAEPEIRMYFNTYPTIVQVDATVEQFKFVPSISLRQAEVSLNPWGHEDPSLRISLGISHFKYNPDSKNLGEYLFRTGTYPAYIRSGFDQSFAKLTGIRASSFLFNNWQQDLILSIETEVHPISDISLSYLTSMQLGNILDIGGGVSFARIIPAVDTITNPKYNEVRYLNSKGDTSYYSYQGTKLNARASLDLKQLFHSDIFGKNDLKIYSEIAVLGWENKIAYDSLLIDTANNIKAWLPATKKNYYQYRKYRTPIMFGMNLPTYKFLDVFAVEFEYYANPYRNSYYSTLYRLANPTPPDPANDYTAEDYKNDNWKWSVFAQKTFTPYLKLLGQIARDHMRHDVIINAERDEEEIFTRAHEYYWALKLECTF